LVCSSGQNGNPSKTLQVLYQKPLAPAEKLLGVSSSGQIKNLFSAGIKTLIS